MKDLLKGFGGNFGDGSEAGSDPSTLLGLIEFARAWTEGVVTSAKLCSAISDLADRSGQAARETKHDLEDKLDPALASVLEGLLDCYVESETELRQMLKRVRKNQDITDSLDVLGVLQKDIGQLSRCLAGWTSGRDPLCARCGSKGPEEVCPECNLERMIPDPSPDPEVRSAHLGPQYVALYHTYRDIVNGDVSLRNLVTHLDSLQRDLRQMQRLSRNSPVSVHHEAEEGLQGLTRMRTALSSRRMRDLNEGWTQVFRGASALAEKLPGLLRKMGQADEASVLEQSRRFQDDASLSV